MKEGGERGYDRKGEGVREKGNSYIHVRNELHVYRDFP